MLVCFDLYFNRAQQFLPHLIWCLMLEVNMFFFLFALTFQSLFLAKCVLSLYSVSSACIPGKNAKAYVQFTKISQVEIYSQCEQRQRTVHK